MRSNPEGGRVWFDPVGVWVPPGTSVRWTVSANVHTATAYHPSNGGRSLRIPEGAEPWDSGYLVNPGDDFTVTLMTEGVYDYFCRPHEAGGMVGRIVVGEPSGPGTLPFDYFTSMTPRPDWQPVPPAAQASFPAIDRILSEKRVSPEL